MPDLLTKDLGWKLFSLLLATALWFTASYILHESAVPVPDASVSTVIYNQLPVTVVSTTADVRAYHVAPVAIKVIVTGPAAAMKTLQAGELHAIVNVTGANLARGVILPVEISSPPKVAIISIEPDHVLVTPPSPPDKKP